MNYKQKLILRKLVEKYGQKYSELFSNFTPEDKFPYHLKYLLAKELILKKDSKYFISKNGMQVTGNFDTRTLEETKTPSLMILYLCQYKDRFLVREHFSHDIKPDRKILSLPFAKPIWGQPIEISAKTEFKRKYQIDLNFKYFCTYHLIDKTADGSILFDDLWLVFQTRVNKINSFAYYQQRNEYWLTPKEISEKQNTHPFIKRLILGKNKKPFFEESTILNYGLVN
jgi:hypothetical protein